MSTVKLLIVCSLISSHNSQLYYDVSDQMLWFSFD